MNSWVRRASYAAAALIVLAVLAWTWRVELALKGVEYLARRQYDIGPPRDIAWDRAPTDAAPGPRERPPNIVLILADDLGWNDLTFHGGGVGGGAVPTPNIDSIAADGVTFTQGYAANGTCAPSRAALMSGRYGTRFGFEFTPTPPQMVPMLDLIGSAREAEGPPTLRREDVETVPFAEMGMPPSEISIAELLGQRGYHTVHIGKWHLGRTNGMAPHEQGFDESLLMTSGLYGRLDDPSVVQSRQDFDPIDRFLWHGLRFAAQYNGGPAFEPPSYLTDYYTDEAVKVIEANRDRPFFLYLAHWAPHTPLQAKKEDYDALEEIPLHRERVYGAMIRSLDRGVGRVLEALEANGLTENTLVLFTSDNGGAGYIGLPEVNAPFRGWKITLFEGGVHVPFFAKWPVRLPAGGVYEQPVQHFDLYATAAAAAGAELPSDRVIDGVDLVPYVTGAVEGVPHDALFWRSGAAQSVRIGDYKMNVSAPEGMPRREWLFDLSRDPGERNDLSEVMPEKLAELRAALAAHDAAQMPPAWPAQLITPINVDRPLGVPFDPGDEFAYWSN